MTPKEEAEELVGKYYLRSFRLNGMTMVLGWENSKQCTLIAIDFAISKIGTKCSECQDEQNKLLNELIELKQEIEKL